MCCSLRRTSRFGMRRRRRTRCCRCSGAGLRKVRVGCFSGEALRWRGFSVVRVTVVRACMLGDAFEVDFFEERFLMRVFAMLSFAVVVSSLPLSGQTKVAAVPPMGWNSWNHFAGHVTDADVRSAADSLVSTGMRDAGYVYVNVDDTWEGKRDAQD